MIAPKRIFMPNELLSEEWQRHIEGQDTEYIRKDEVIKWLHCKSGYTIGIDGATIKDFEEETK